MVLNQYIIASSWSTIDRNCSTHWTSQSISSRSLSYHHSSLNKRKKSKTINEWNLRGIDRFVFLIQQLQHYQTKYQVNIWEAENKRCNWLVYYYLFDNRWPSLALQVSRQRLYSHIGTSASIWYCGASFQFIFFALF